MDALFAGIGIFLMLVGFGIFLDIVTGGDLLIRIIKAIKGKK